MKRENDCTILNYYRIPSVKENFETQILRPLGEKLWRKLARDKTRGEMSSNVQRV